VCGTLGEGIAISTVVSLRFERAKRVHHLITVDHHPELLEAADTHFRVTIDSDGKSHAEEIVSE
jgi:hypothetical protein